MPDCGRIRSRTCAKLIPLDPVEKVMRLDLLECRPRRSIGEQPARQVDQDQIGRTLNMALTDARIVDLADSDTLDSTGKRKFSCREHPIWVNHEPSSDGQRGTVIRNSPSTGRCGHTSPGYRLHRRVRCRKGAARKFGPVGDWSSRLLKIPQRQPGSAGAPKWNAMAHLVHDDATRPEIDLGSVRRKLVMRLACRTAAGTVSQRSESASASFLVVRVCLLEVERLGMCQDLGSDVVRRADQGSAVLARYRGRAGQLQERSRRPEIGQEEVALGIEQ